MGSDVGNVFPDDIPSLNNLARQSSAATPQQQTTAGHHTDELCNPCLPSVATKDKDT